jgi:hypothetical protein
MMIPRVRAGMLCVAGLLSAAPLTLAQVQPPAPLHPERVKSMGQPPLIKPYLSGQFT